MLLARLYKGLIKLLATPPPPQCPYPVGVVSPDEATVQSPASELLGLWTPAPNGATSGTGIALLVMITS